MGPMIPKEMKYNLHNRKNSKKLVENLKAQSLHSVNSLKSFDFSTLYITIPHDKLKSKLKEIINQFFSHKEW